ncbi:MAG TPA: hypothetical protein VF062_12140 [Candidatus Limnocylindrales bacterium]
MASILGHRWAGDFEREGNGRLLKVDQVRDRYNEVDGVWLPEHRVVTTATDTGLATRTLSFSGHRLREA